MPHVCNRAVSFLTSVASALCFVAPVLAQQLVAPTEALTPAEQQKKFHLPPGFEIQLVAHEPDVNKPMNMKFDAHGRLWVSHSLEYPFPAKSDEQARDAISIFSQFGPDGRAGRVQRFAEKLNIPIGVLPLNDREALAWSIPNIFRLIDSDGDGVADRREVAFGTFAFIDTHGNQNAFTRWVDGWVYANHGFNNQSQPKLRGEGDVALEMKSGNTYRYRADASAIELYSAGQVNPFGLAFDPLGNLFSADCHSRPTTMLLREGHYQSFGKPHDGLGFAPETTDLDHGGTGIAGVAYYAADQFPAEYQDALFLGNVITNRVHCDRLSWTGSSPRVAKVEDFVTCDDPWFRPVDVQLGPDGALYIADFYNCIIGHYEVPLTHPRRDRERGRIWRVVYKGDNGLNALPAVPDLTTTSPADLVALLGSPNLNLRVSATNALVDRFGKDAAAAVLPALQSTGDTPAEAARRAHALWVVFRTGAIDQALAKSLAADSSPHVRVHLLGAIAETPQWQPWQFELVRGKLADANPFVVRAATVALARHPAIDNVGPLLKLLTSTPVGDAQLVHAARIAVRDQLRSSELATSLPKLKLDEAERRTMLEVAAAVPTGPAALLIYDEALRGNVDQQLLGKALPAAAQFIDAAQIDTLLEFLQKKYPDDAPYRLSLLRGLRGSLARRGLEPTKLMIDTLTELLRPALSGAEGSVWVNVPVPGAAPSAAPWTPQPRAYSDGERDIPAYSSLREGTSKGEHMTGILRSPAFTLPAKLSFFMCGHNGPPNTPDAKKNYARLVLLDGTEVARSYPPRSDVAQRFEWDLSAAAGKRGYVEVVDAAAAEGFAWLAVSRFEPPVLRVPDRALSDDGASRTEMVQLVGELRIAALGGEVARLAHDAACESSTRLAACEALIALQNNDAVAVLESLLADAAQSTVNRQRAAELLGRLERDDAQRALVAQLRAAPQPVALTIATALAGRKETAAKLLELVRLGHASPTLLREAAIVERLKTADVPDLQKQIAELTARLTPNDDRIVKLIEQRRAGYLAGKFDPAAGQAVFARSVCVNCHRIGETGKMIGPALDGIGNRGLDRVLEDLLDPNRNIDQAFKATIVETEAGQTFTVFGVREEGKQLVMFDSTGKMLQMPLNEIADRHPTGLSPMPGNISEQIPEQDFYRLIAYLLSLNVKK